jgi:glucosamine--fructose-6-phosphate aminotransferase (isomerizing)
MVDPIAVLQNKEHHVSLPRIIIVGNLTIDDVVLPNGTTQMGSIGGNSLYSALGARLWEPRVGIVTRRGEDFPPDLLDQLQRLGIAIDGITAIAGPTVRNWIVYEENGDRHWLYRTPRERSREVAVHPEDIPSAWLAIDPPPIVHIAAMPLDAAEAIVLFVRERCPQALITFDTHEDYVIGYRERLLALAQQVAAFMPSRSELADLMGYDDPLHALQELASSLSTRAIVVKLGPEGALLWDRACGQMWQIEAIGSQVVDVTGAGDAFCGGFAAGLAAGDSPLEATRKAMVSAAFAVEGFSSVHLLTIQSEEAKRRLADSPPPAKTLPRSRRARSNTAMSDIQTPITVMYDEITMIPTVLADQCSRLTGPLRELAADLVCSGIQHLYLVGCGDSAFAGSAATLAFRKHAGVYAEGIHALEMARYRVRYLPKPSAVVCISLSGRVGRTVEAAAQARAFGHRVIALTGNPTSPLVDEATDVLTLQVPTLGYTPGTSTYLAILITLLNLAVQWKAARGDDVREVQAMLQQLPHLAAKTLACVEESANTLAQRFARAPWITFLGAGPNEATAHFGAAKLLEGPGILGVATNTEEWAHEEYFVSGKGTPIIMIVPSGASLDRSMEILQEIEFIGAEVVVISDQALSSPPGTHIPLAGGVMEEFSPILAALPLSLLAFFLTRARGRQSFGFPSRAVAQEHYETIHRFTRGNPA